MLAAFIWFSRAGQLGGPAFPAIYVGLACFFLIGFFDDLKSIPAVPRLLMQFGAAGLTVWLSAGSVSMSSLLGRPISEPLAWALSIIWIVGVVNTFNWIDGLDGLSAGIAGISATAFLVLALVNPALPNALLTAILCSILVGALAGFLPFNFFPARIFIGDGGAFILGYLLAVISIAGLFKQAAVISFVIPVAILALPIGDTLFAIVRRAMKGQKITTPDNKHIHHRVLGLLSRRYADRYGGEGHADEQFVRSAAHRSTVLILYSLAAIFAAIAVAAGLRA
jgi:UDP-GlcNAc:undecaprenyl-phosphate GlcNAc-1-phosphate transferase